MLSSDKCCRESRYGPNGTVFPRNLIWYNELTLLTVNIFRKEKYVEDVELFALNPTDDRSMRNIFNLYEAFQESCTPFLILKKYLQGS